MFSWLCKPILRAILQCLGGYDDEAPQAESNANGAVVRPGFRGIELPQGEEAINPDLQISVNPPSATYRVRNGRKGSGTVDLEPTTEFTTQLSE